MTKENQQKEVLCPYCESKFRDRIELSKHIDGVHTGLGLLEGNTKGWWIYSKPLFDKIITESSTAEDQNVFARIC